jgi:hypothetical protein
MVVQIPTSANHIEGCKVLLAAVQRDAVLPPPSFVASASDRAVCVEWQWKHIRLEAEVADDRIEWMYFPENGNSEFFDTTWDLQTNASGRAY